MSAATPIWLVTNPSSGSNDEDTVDSLRQCCEKHCLTIARIIEFPDEKLPTAAELNSAQTEIVAVFAGDGTINALITSLYGWSGAILVLEGGTMNLLYHRLHGDASQDDVMCAVAAGRAQRVRPALIRCAYGDSLAGLLAGPGTSWNEVREAMRKADVAALAEGAVEAIEKSTGGPMVTCAEPALGRTEGYPLVMLTPREDGFEVRGYHSETTGEYLSQAMALLKRNFREGPHDFLGKETSVKLASVGRAPIGLSVDGEAKEGRSEETFELAACEVDLLATLPHVE